MPVTLMGERVLGARHLTLTMPLSTHEYNGYIILYHTNGYMYYTYYLYETLCKDDSNMQNITE